MNQDKLKLWLDALRSGEYEQTTNYLNSNGKYCCLGVLCEVAIKDGLDLEKKVLSDGLFEYEGDYAHLPIKALEWLGIDLPANEDDEGEVLGYVPQASDYDEIQGEYEGDDYRKAGPVSVMYLNDEVKWNFSQIADAIEKVYVTKPEEVSA